MFCKHKWKILSEHVSESIAEQRVRLGHTSLVPDNLYGAQGLSEKVRILTLTCENCGKLKHFKDGV